jgi:phospholipid/cholesterol/gamma-HCH transport system ATP-binding protein
LTILLQGILPAPAKRTGSSPNGGLWVPETEIAVRELTKSFGSQVVLEDITCDIPKGKITLMLGPSGTGKSVFLKHIMGLLKPDHGEIWIDGKNLPELPHRELYAIRRKFGVLFQDGALFGSMNIYDNVAFPLREHTRKSERDIREIVTEKLGMVGLTGAEGKLPGEISGGMKKRAGLARALVLDPEIVLFDEPDSGLDPVRTAFLNELILDLNRKLGPTMVVVTHDIATARRVADFIGMLYLRNLIYFGSKQECFDTDVPAVRQFLSGDTKGPIGMSEEADQTKAHSSSGLTAEETEQMERDAGAPEREGGAREYAGAPPRPDRGRDVPERPDQAQGRVDGAPPRPDRKRVEASEHRGEEPGQPSQEAKEEGDRRQQEAEQAMDRIQQKSNGPDAPAQRDRGQVQDQGSPLDDLWGDRDRSWGERREER